MTKMHKLELKSCNFLTIHSCILEFIRIYSNYSNSFVSISNKNLHDLGLKKLQFSDNSFVYIQIISNSLIYIYISKSYSIQSYNIRIHGYSKTNPHDLGLKKLQFSDNSYFWEILKSSNKNLFSWSHLLRVPGSPVACQPKVP